MLSQFTGAYRFGRGKPDTLILQPWPIGFLETTEFTLVPLLNTTRQHWAEIAIENMVFSCETSGESTHEVEKSILILVFQKKNQYNNIINIKHTSTITDHWRKQRPVKGLQRFTCNLRRTYNCLKGRHAHHYTTVAVRKKKKRRMLLSQEFTSLEEFDCDERNFEFF